MTPSPAPAPRARLRGPAAAFGSGSAGSAGSGGSAAAAQPEFAPRPQPQHRPAHLLVVPDPRVLRARRLARLATALAGLAACFGLFGVVGLRVMLAQGQGPLESLEREVNQRQEEQRRLRLQVAQLESPARVVAAARERLGMVTPPTVVPLAPASLADPPATTIPAPRPTTTTVLTSTTLATDATLATDTDDAAADEPAGTVQP